jgi:FkbM family methyltransferase
MRSIRTLSLVVRRQPTLSRWALRSLPDLPITVQVRDLGPFRVRLRTNRSFWLRDPLTHEHEPMLMLSALARPGGFALDVGANLGVYSRFLVRGLGQARVVAFEPWETNCRRFRDNAVLGQIEDRVLLLPYALSDVDGPVKFQVDDFQTTSGALDAASPGQASVGRANVGLAPRITTVESRRLDSLVRDGTIERTDLIKVDIEGGEGLMLLGATDVLASRSADWMVELHGAAVAQDVARQFLRHGYECRAFGAAFGTQRYGVVTEPALERVTGMYDLHFLAASTRPAALIELDHLVAARASAGART